MKRKNSPSSERDFMMNLIFEKKSGLNHDMEHFFKDEQILRNEFKLETDNKMTILLCKLIQETDRFSSIERCIDMVFKDLTEKEQFDEIFKILQCSNQRSNILSDIIVKYEDLIFDLVLKNLDKSYFLIENDRFNHEKFLTKHEDHPDLTKIIRTVDKVIDLSFYSSSNNQKLIKGYCDSVRGIEDYYSSRILAEIFINHPELFNWHFKQQKN